MPLSKAGFLLIAGIKLVTYTTVEGALYGFSLALYVACAQSLYLQLQDRDRRRQNLFTLIYTSIIIALALYGLAMDSLQVRVSYVDHADYPRGGGYGYSLEVFQQSAIAVSGYAVTVSMQLMLVCIQIWRLWIIWKTSRYSRVIMVLPVLALFIYFGFQITTIVILALSEETPNLINLMLYGILSPQLFISATVTILIIIRIIMIRRETARIMGHAANTNNPYTSVISMLVESFALESVWIIVLFFLIPFPTSRPIIYAVSIFLSSILTPIQVLAYFLVVYRVTTGRGWNEDTADKQTTLHWNVDGLQITQSDIQTSIPISHGNV